ncbi:hypothetical protein COB57_06075 [Candidatus Peregrinibacteria bacterium]|nr:MAG: hypothetical protein COB57_06075 [Candidatus Peregrinibacteria bacterium]
MRMHICKNKTAEETKEAIIKTLDEFPIQNTHTLTFDNGTENMKHTEIQHIFELDTYFCDPYSSWQKGLVEQTNMLIRRYLPRYINLSQVSASQLLEIQEKINNRPRKSLNYLSPNQFYQSLI